MVTKFRDFSTMEMNMRTGLSPLWSFSSSIIIHQADSHSCVTGSTFFRLCDAKNTHSSSLKSWGFIAKKSMTVRELEIS